MAEPQSRIREVAQPVELRRGWRTEGPTGPLALSTLSQSQAIENELRNVGRILHFEHLETGGAAAGDARLRILHHQGCACLQPLGGQQIRVWSRLVARGIAGAHQGVEIAAKPARLEQRL